MKNKFIRFMYGRNGSDELVRFTSYASAIILLLTMFFGGAVSATGLVIAILLMICTYFRVFSKNLEARRRENTQFLRFKQGFLEWFKLRRDMWKQRKDYKFFKCSACKSVLRVPRGKGKIRILCKKCGAAFEKKT